MLRVNPKDRPSCAEILEMPEVRRNVGKTNLRALEKVAKSADQDELLKTIRLPRDNNLRAITSRLPKANYEEPRHSAKEERRPLAPVKEVKRSMELL